MLALRPADILTAPTAAAVAHPALTDLARRFRERWVAGGSRLSTFADLAASSLEEARLHERLSADEVLDLVLLAPDLPSPRPGENEFGYPTVTAVRDEHFRIEFIFWRASAAQAHHHGPPGAFQVLRGRRLNNEYRFRPQSGGGDLIDLGELQRVRSTLMQPGDVCAIPEGEGMIHALAFLEPLCLTVTLRARTWEHDVSDNTLYMEPHVRYSPRSLLERRLTAMETLHLARAWGSPERVRAVLRSCPGGAFALLLSLVEAGQAAVFAALAAEVDVAHGEMGRLVVRSVEEQARRRQLVEGLRRVPIGQNPESEYAQRLLLGLAWTGVDTAESLALVGRSRAGAAELLRAGAAGLRQSFGEAALGLSPLIAAHSPPAATNSPVPLAFPIQENRSLV